MKTQTNQKVSHYHVTNATLKSLAARWRLKGLRINGTALYK